MLATVLSLMLIILCTVPCAQADWLYRSGAETAPTIAEITVNDDHVEVVLEIFIGDIQVFADLMPDDWLQDVNIARPSYEERIKGFSENTFQIIADGGEPLQAELRRFEPRMRKDRKSPIAGTINPRTRRLVPQPPADKRVAYAELVYPFKTRPQELTIVPPLDPDGSPRNTIGFIAYHKAVPIIDFWYLGLPAHLQLNWDDPWYTRFSNRNLKRHHASALMSYLYVEPYEVRHEILTRVKDLEAWMDLGLRGDEYIEIDEFEPLKRRVSAFLLSKNPLRMDGKLARPILDRANYVQISLSGLQIIEASEKLELSTAIIGVIVAYITEGLPDKVTVDWELFNDEIKQVPATAIDAAGPLTSYLDPKFSVLTWENFLHSFPVPEVSSITVDADAATFRLPVGSVLCFSIALLSTWQIIGQRRRRKKVILFTAAGTFAVVGATLLTPYLQVSVTRPAIAQAELSEETAKRVLEGLLKNVYRAFDFRQEEDIYDKLAVSVAGDLLSDIYLQNRRSFAVQQAGGAQAQVKTVTLLAATPQPRPKQRSALAFHTEWTALGQVGHWGHVHTRQNRYEALLTVAPVSGAWKIVELELLEEKRMDPTTPATTKAG